MNMPTTRATHTRHTSDVVCTRLEANAAERSAFANGYEAGTVHGITIGMEQKMKGIYSILQDTSLSDNHVRLLLKRMCSLELIKE